MLIYQKKQKGPVQLVFEDLENMEKTLGELGLKAKQIHGAEKIPRKVSGKASDED